MTLIVILNAVLAVTIVGVIVALHSHAIVAEHRLHRRRAVRAARPARAPRAAEYWRERQAA